MPAGLVSTGWMLFHLLGSAMTTPLVSVIVPTFRRPQYLADAVMSALDGMGNGVEVIVVPNGPDTSWRQALSHFSNDNRVRVEPLVIANGNAARNHGLDCSRGTLIRFLDDDDYLYPEVARQQYTEIERGNADVVSADVALVDDVKHSVVAVRQQPDVEDFCVATLGPTKACLPHLHVYRRDAIGDVRWNPATRIRQDLEWQLDLCARREWRWSKLDKVVGVWRQHRRGRVSQEMSRHISCMTAAEMIIRTCHSLEEQHRLSNTRRRSAADGLWALIHRAFHLAPGYWTRMAHIARDMSPASRPRSIPFHWPVVRQIDPVAVEYALLPARSLWHVAKLPFVR